MCYAIPGKIIGINNNIARIEYFGEEKEALVDIEGLKAGDYVFSQGGMIIERIQEEDALGILNSWRDIFFQLRERDVHLSERDNTSENTDTEISAIIRKGEDGIALSKEEMITLLQCHNADDINLLYKTANRIRQRRHRNSSCVHGIIEFSNFCRNDCAYCGIRQDNHEIDRYRMTADEIVEEVVSSSINMGFKAFVLQSGEDGYYTTRRLVDIVSRIKERCNIILILSIGERDVDCYRELYDAGARGILMRFETSNPGLYERLHSTLHYEKRIQILKALRDMGYIMATGSLIGLPEQKEEDLCEDILLACSFNPEMYSFGPLVAHPATPLASVPPVDLDTILKVIAVTRLMHHDGNLLVTSAVESLYGREGTRKVLMAGANSMMINLTPGKYHKLYTIYPREDHRNAIPAQAGMVESPPPFEDIQSRISETISLLYSLGRAPTDIGIGGTKKHERRIPG